jgi:hypothetical protein
MRPTSSIPVASPAPVLAGPLCHAFAWVLPGGSCRDRSYRCRVNSNGGVRSGTDSIDRGLFAWTRLAPHLGTDAHRAASGILPHPHARRLHRRWPGTETAVGTPTHRSRFSRRLFHPRLRLRPRFLAGEEGSTPWTRPPFTPRRPRDRPGRHGRWRSLYGTSSGRLSTSAACKERRTSTTDRAFVLAARRGPQPSSRFVRRGDSPLARDEADGPRATCSGEVTPDSLSPRKGLGEPDMSPTIHLDDALRRRLPVALAAWAGRPSEGLAPLGGLREFPSSAPPVHPFVIDAPSAGSGVSPRPKAATDRDPRSAAPPRRRATSGGPGCFPPPTVRPVRIDHSMRPASDRSPLTPLLRKEHCEAPRHRSRWKRRASAFDALAGENERLCVQPGPPNPDE